MESFFSSLKTERTNRKHYLTRNAARADVFDYIERFYNPLRRHSTLGNLSPANFEWACRPGRYGGSEPHELGNPRAFKPFFTRSYLIA
jgi:hypothetical protein